MKPLLSFVISLRRPFSFREGRKKSLIPALVLSVLSSSVSQSELLTSCRKISDREVNQINTYSAECCLGFCLEWHMPLSLRSGEGHIRKDVLGPQAKIPQQGYIFGVRKVLKEFNICVTNVCRQRF